MAKIKPIISYLGGKISMVDDINFIVNKVKPKCVVDLFGGGGSILLNISNVKSKVYNDKDSEIVNLFRVIQDKELNDKLVHYFNNIIVSREMFEEFKYQDINTLTQFERAKRTIYLWKCAFSSRRNSETSFSFGYSKARAVHSMETVAKQLPLLLNVVKQWYIENLDFTQIIPKYDGDDTLFIIDPPYYVEGKNTKYYKHNMSSVEDQYFIRDEILKIKGKFLITYPNTDFYRELYKDFNFIDVKKLYRTENWGNGNGKEAGNTNEMIITNFEVN